MKAENSIADNVDNAIFKAAFIVKTQAQRNIQTGNRSGALYKRGKSGITGQRSAPGEYPKTDTGVLAKNIYAEKRAFGVSVVGTNIEHGQFLENGTRNMEARPWLEPTYLESTDKIGNLVYRAARKGLDPQ